MSVIKFKSSEKGISILFVVLIASVILAMGLGISTILLQQTKMMREIGYSVVSFYAADSGIEKAIFDLYNSNFLPQPQTGSVGEASFETMACCGRDVSDEECPDADGFVINPDCSAPNYCLKSTGIYKNTRRAIEIQY